MPKHVLVSRLLIAAMASLVALGIEYYVFAIAYPGFAFLQGRVFLSVHALHVQRITYAIGPALLGAFVANALLVVDRPRGLPAWLPIVATLAGAAILAYTALVAVPLHAKLGEGADTRTIVNLNATEWARMLLTFVQAAADVAMLWYALRR